MPDNSSSPLAYQVFDPERQEMDVVVVPPLRTRYWLHILLFLATLLSTLCIGARLQYDFDRNTWPFAGDEYWLDWGWGLANPRYLASGIPFALSLLAILTAHEFGHYVLCRRRNVLATLPFFIPFPSLFGTLGAVIRIRSPIACRKDLFDIGIAGPIAGFVVAMPILVVSLLHSRLLTIDPSASWPVIGLPVIFDLVRRLLAALGSQAPAAQVHAHLYLAPTAVAAWVGMLATSLNLLPGGQLDGGHIVFALSPRHHRLISVVSVLVLLILSWYFWAGWLLWALVLIITTSRHPMVPMHPALPVRSRILALVAALMLALTLIPAPVAESSLPQAIDSFRHDRHADPTPSK